MIHRVTIKGDMNDADYASETCDINLDSNIFEDWDSDYSKIKVTYLDFFVSLGKALKKILHTQHYNFKDNIQEKVLDLVIEDLQLKDSIVDSSDLHEVLWDFLPAGGDYPIHTILEINAIPITSEGYIFY